nr:MAG TPA: hypothetical protein [Caudoviricetes sp.]
MIVTTGKRSLLSFTWSISKTMKRLESRSMFSVELWGPQNEVSKGEWGKGLRDRKIQKRGCKTNCPRA